MKRLRRWDELFTLHPTVRRLIIEDISGKFATTKVRRRLHVRQKVNKHRVTNIKFSEPATSAVQSENSHDASFLADRTG